MLRGVRLTSGATVHTQRAQAWVGGCKFQQTLARKEGFACALSKAARQVCGHDATLRSRHRSLEEFGRRTHATSRRQVERRKEKGALQLLVPLLAQHSQAQNNVDGHAPQHVCNTAQRQAPKAEALSGLHSGTRATNEKMVTSLPTDRVVPRTSVRASVFFFISRDKPPPANYGFKGISKIVEFRFHAPPQLPRWYHASQLSLASVRLERDKRRCRGFHSWRCFTNVLRALCIC